MKNSATPSPDPAQESSPNNTLPTWFRWTGIALGAIFVFWLPFEETSFKLVIGLGIGVTAWLVTRFWMRQPPHILWKIVGAGFLGGLAVAPLAVILIIFKSGLHDHGGFEFPPEQIFEILLQTPFWGMSGLFFSLGVRLVELTNQGNR